ncbi:hypothetical protein Pcinc_009264 [Petrolisthes cinctipes]|uniref:Endonuclease/exonuclease/phosphatase domain-containing protein n=1 Tax=Petrolisthes cinctipes TaxID=88211 RepID=A0AAE1G5M3_PETCI|nr:hypothetical protein Pcinc_009264 [Petrolisthes cinctipes]
MERRCAEDASHGDQTAGPPRLKVLQWNVQGLRPKRHQAYLDEWWADYQPPDDLHQQERDLTAAIQTAATTAIPMCVPSRRHRTDWWYYNDEVREHNHRVNLHQKLYKKRPNPNNLRLLQEVVARARQVSLRAKEDKWLEWCATFSQHTSLGQHGSSASRESIWPGPTPISTSPPDDLHQKERDLTAAIQTAATTAIPMCVPSRRHRTDWWYYNDEVREHNHRVNLHWKLYKKRPNPNNLRLLQEVVARTRQVSLRSKEDKWL